MITIFKMEEIKDLMDVSKELKDELLCYFQEIAEGIVGEGWETYNFCEVGPILVIENTDTVEVLEEYGLMQGNKCIPQSIPEFALKIDIDGVKMLKIIWVCNDSFGLSVYYPIGRFGKEFDEFVKEYVIE